MNTAEFSDLLSKLPGDLLADAFQNTNLNSQAQHDKSAELSGPALPITPPDDKILVPRWITVTALAACMLFAVGVGAMLLRGQRDDLTTQSSQSDSSEAEIVTAILTETSAPVTTASEPAGTSGTQITAAGTVTVYTTAVSIPEEITEPQEDTTPPETAVQDFTEPVQTEEVTVPSADEITPVESATTELSSPDDLKPKYRKGDVNRDGEITIEDAELVLKETNNYYAADLSHYLDEEQLELAEMEDNYVLKHLVNPEIKVTLTLRDALLIEFYCEACDADPALKEMDIVEWCKANYPQLYE